MFTTVFNVIDRLNNNAIFKNVAIYGTFGIYAYSYMKSPIVKNICSGKPVTFMDTLFNALTMMYVTPLIAALSKAYPVGTLLSTVTILGLYYLGDSGYISNNKYKKIE